MDGDGAQTQSFDYGEGDKPTEEKGAVRFVGESVHFDIT